MEITKGLSFKASCEVTYPRTALAMGSGDMEVFATPAMIALMEKAAMQCISHLVGEGNSSVGIAIESSHIKATPMGAEVVATATVTEVDGRKISFEIEAKDNAGVIGVAKHDRFIVNKEKFLSKL